MSTATLERTETTVVPAQALTTTEQNALVSLVASVTKTSRVRGGRRDRSVRTSRAWSYKGDVD